MDDLCETNFSIGMRPGGVAIEFNNEAYLHTFCLDEAKALRDWLNKAIPPQSDAGADQ